MAEILSMIGMVVLIVLGILMITLLAYAVRILIIIYSFFGSKKSAITQSDEGDALGGIGKFIKSASVIQIILFLLRSRGRFRK